MKKPIMVSYDIVSQASSEQGDIAEHGVVLEGQSLREAIDALRETRTSQVGGVQAAELCQTGTGHCISISNGMEFLTGDYETRYLHLKDVSAASAQRVLALAQA
jgi:hypothetical protein